MLFCIYQLFKFSGNFPLLSVKTKEENSPLKYFVTENTAGVPDNDLVTLSLNGTVSNPVSVADLTLDKVYIYVTEIKYVLDLTNDNLSSQVGMVTGLQPP